MEKQKDLEKFAIPTSDVPDSSSSVKFVKDFGKKRKY